MLEVSVNEAKNSSDSLSEDEFYFSSLKGLCSVIQRHHEEAITLPLFTGMENKNTFRVMKAVKEQTIDLCFRQVGRGEKVAITVFPDFSVSPYPRVVRIEPSSLCNLKCIHCPTGTRRDIKRGNMSDKVFRRIIEELKTYGAVDVVVLYHAGEPFLNKNIFEIINVVLRSIEPHFIKTVTNGMLIKDEMLPKIIKSGLDSIEFSLDGLSPEENNQIRRGGGLLPSCFYSKKVAFHED